jgi:hypothetical protein
MNAYRVESDMKHFSKEDLEALPCEDEMTEDTRVWLKQLVVNTLRGTCREPDWSFQPCEDNFAFYLRQLQNGTDGEEWVNVHSPQKVYEKFSGIANYIHGYRVIKDLADGDICVSIKPKIRYSALRHVFEYSLHNWAISNDLGNELLSFSGPIGS